MNSRSLSVQLAALRPRGLAQSAHIVKYLRVRWIRHLPGQWRVADCPVSPYSDNDTLESASIGECISVLTLGAQRLTLSAQRLTLSAQRLTLGAQRLTLSAQRLTRSVSTYSTTQRSNNRTQTISAQ